MTQVSISDLRIIRLRCEYRENPLGVDETRPLLSWALRSERRGSRPAAIQIHVATSVARLAAGEPDLWDSGRVDAADSGAVANSMEYDGKPLASRMRCHWRARVWNETGAASPWSTPAFWEMGLLSPDDWKGRWIGADPALRGDHAPLFRKTVAVGQTPVRARLYICGLGVYEASINGRVVGDQVLDPAQTDYPVRCFYAVHDVTDHLRAGDNALCVTLGDGWFNQNRVWGEKGFSYGEPRLLAQLEIEYADGARRVVATGTDWRTQKFAITRNNIYAGESYDARLEIAGCDQPKFDDAAWPAAVVVPAPGGRLEVQPMSPMRRCRTLAVRDIRSFPDGSHVLDFGQNLSGWVRLRVAHLPSGTRIQMRFAEAIHADGTLDPASTGVFATFVVQTDEYICKGAAEEIWEPRFTYHGFRYVEVTGLPVAPEPGMFTAVFVHSHFAPAGSFACSDAMLNRLHDMAMWTHLSNVHGLPEDCPARERCGWLADGAIVAEYSILNFDNVAFWRKYLDDIETTRQGGIPWDIAPGMRLCLRGVPDWISALILIPWRLYLHTGDARILARHWEGMRLVIEDFGMRHSDWILSGGRGDWCDPGSNTSPSHTPEVVTTTAWFFHLAEIMTRVARVLGHNDDAVRYGDWAPRIRKAFIGKFYDEAAHSFGSQTANAMAICFGLVPDGGEEAVGAALEEDIVVRHQVHFTTGILGVRYFGDALARTGRGPLALQIFNQTTPPSFGDVIARGATTLWEYWGEFEVDKADGARSLNHPMFGGFDTWFYEGLAGIRPDPDCPGYRRVLLSPQWFSGLDHAGAMIETTCGTVASEWRREEDGIHWRVEIPPGSTGRVDVAATDIHDLRLAAEGGAIDRIPGIADVAIHAGRLTMTLASGRYRFLLGRGGNE